MYIDPNTGGMLVQILAVVFAVLSGVVVIYSSKIKMFIARIARFNRERLAGKAKPEESENQQTPGRN